MAAFAALNLLVVALLLIFVAVGFATADELSSSRGNDFAEAAGSEREEVGENARAGTSLLEGRTAEARQPDFRYRGLTDGAAASKNDKSGDVLKLGFGDDVFEEIKKRAERRVSEKLRKPWPRQKEYQSEEEDSNEGLKSVADRLASGFGTFRLDHSVDVMQKEHELEMNAPLSVEENKPPRKRTLQESQDPSTKKDALNTSPPVGDDQTNKTGVDSKVEVQDQAKGSDTTESDPKKENHGAVDSSPNITDASSQANNNSSESKSDVKGDASNESSKPQLCCGDDKKLKACLSGAGAEELSLSLHGYDLLHIIVKTPPFLTADPVEFELSKGETKLVQIHPLHVEAVRDVISSQINITFESGVCSIDVPTENLGFVSRQSYFYGFPYSAIRTPIVGFGMLFAVLVLFLGIWSWCKCLGGRRHGDSLKYQELELSHSSVVDHREEESNGWDEVWDDSWEDTEAARSSSRLTQTLSSKGLAPRRSNKETWEKWDD